MSWVISVTAIAGGFSAGFLTYLIIGWFSLQRNDGADLGYYIVFVPVGLIAGLVAGVVIARFVSSFWLAQGLSLAVILAVCGVVAFVVRMYLEVPPKLDGDEVVLHVELRYPHGWEAKAGERFCEMRPMGPGQRMGKAHRGIVDWEKAASVDGQWVVPCEIFLFTSRDIRFVSYYLNKEWVQFALPLPSRPTNKNKDWSPWTSEGFSQVTGYSFRYRVQRVSEIPKAPEVVVPDFAAEREKAADAIPADAPVSEWLPLFEDPQETPAVYRWGGAERKERKAVAAKVLELAPLLQSSDRAVVRQAVFALGSLYETPEALVDPLIVAGKWSVHLINEAGTDPDSERKARQFFDMWNIARKNAGAGQAARFGGILGEIEKAAAGGKGDLGSIVQGARER